MNPDIQAMQAFNQSVNSQGSTDPDVQAMQIFNQSPQDITKAQMQTGNQDENGECQQFVEQMTTGHSGIFPSAMAAASYYSQSGQLKPGLNGAKPGDLVYLSDPNQPDGHVGILTDNNGDFVSATYNGVQTNSLQNWTSQTGQQILGHVSVGGIK